MRDEDADDLPVIRLLLEVYGHEYSPKQKVQRSLAMTSKYSRTLRPWRHASGFFSTRLWISLA